MWNLLKKSGQECARVQDCLEDAAAQRSNAGTIEELIAGLPAAARKHIDGCGVCWKAALDLVATKELFKGVASVTEDARPWFAARVMAAIAAREQELAERVSAWSEFPRFASRLAWVSAVVLLAGTTWFYEKGVRAPSNPPNGTAQESIFEAPPPTNQDDVLISMAGSNP
jgi:dihydrodipicolinate synthase/N-acetylneuraminate lyase